jgi:Flp pilus assembly protein TadD
MILGLLVAASVAAAPAPAPAAAVKPVELAEIAHAIEAKRFDQARLMIARAIGAGAEGYDIDRLTADLAFARGNNDEALARYEQLIAANPKDSLIAERAGIAALKLGQVDRAAPLIERATASPAASWRAWNAKGVLADLQGDWAAADEAYGRALALAPGNADIANNPGSSQLLRGNWQVAVESLERAARLDHRSARIADNLELARAANTAELPRRRDGESDRDWAERLNDAGVAAQIRGNRTKAIAAYTQALEASDSWYSRAANNLAALTAPQ